LWQLLRPFKTAAPAKEKGKQLYRPQQSQQKQIWRPIFLRGRKSDSELSGLVFKKQQCPFHFKGNTALLTVKKSRLIKLRIFF